MHWQAIFEAARRDFIFILPEAMLTFFGLSILLTDFLLTKSQKSWNAFTAMIWRDVQWRFRLDAAELRCASVRPRGRL